MNIKKSTVAVMALLLSLLVLIALVPITAMAAGNSTVVLHPSVKHTVSGVKVKVGDKIDGHPITKISGNDITVDLGKYNVNNDTFRLPYAKDIWTGVDNNKVDYISWAGSGSNRRSEGASALLANGKNTAYYYFKGEPVLPTFTLNYDANGGTGAPASQTYKATSQYEKSHSFTVSSVVPTRDGGYTFLGWSTDRNATTASYKGGSSIVVTGTTTLYAIWKSPEPESSEVSEPESSEVSEPESSNTSEPESSNTSEPESSNTSEISGDPSGDNSDESSNTGDDSNTGDNESSNAGDNSGAGDNSNAGDNSGSSDNSNAGDSSDSGKNPQTGENSFTLMIALLFLCGSAVVGTAVVSRKQKAN